MDTKDTFTPGVYRELLPPVPSVFTASLIANCATQLASRSIVRLFYGRPCINIALMSEFLRGAGVPEHQIPDIINGKMSPPREMNLTTMAGAIAGLTKWGISQSKSVNSAKKAGQEILQYTENPGNSFTECMDKLCQIYMLASTEMLSLTIAIGPILHFLRSIGVLEEHASREQTISTEIYTDLEPLREFARKHDEVRLALALGKLPKNRKFLDLWDDYLHKHGHRGIYENDIARPRYRENPRPLLDALLSHARPRQEPPPLTRTGKLTQPLWRYASQAIHARENLRSDAIKAYGRIRERLLELAEDKFTDSDHLWMLTLEEVRQLDNGWQPDEPFFRERQAEIDHFKNYELPDLFSEDDDLETYRKSGAAHEKTKSLHGISLTHGKVRGVAWVLDEPETRLPEDFDEDSTILVVRTVDTDWIPTYTRVAGVVSESGNDVSHGSIVLREIGMPAMTNVEGATLAFETGDEIILRVDQGIVERV